MKQENKDLLLKDLCCRLPYKVKIETLDGSQEFDIKWLSINMCNIANPYLPYLYPLSNITEEQYNSLRELGILNNCSHNYEYVNPYTHGVSFIFKQFKTYSLELIEWLNKNHFDYRGLIEKGLAINAIGKNIY